MAAKITEDQLREIVYQVFQIIDLNQNGVLEEDEVRDFFKTMIAKHQPSRTFSEASFKANWNKMDRNGDDKIDFDELWKFMYAKALANGTIWKATIVES